MANIYEKAKINNGGKFEFTSQLSYYYVKPIRIWSGKGSMQRQLCCSPDGSFQSSMVIRQFPVLPIRGQAVECRAALNNLRLRAYAAPRLLQRAGQPAGYARQKLRAGACTNPFSSIFIIMIIMQMIVSWYSNSSQHLLSSMTIIIGIITR